MLPTRNLADLKTHRLKVRGLRMILYANENEKLNLKLRLQQKTRKGIT